MVAVVIIIVLVVLIGLYLVTSYNRFIRQRNLVQESWRQIDVELQRRHDLIPNLIETVKGFTAQEKSVLLEVTQARTAAMQARAGGPAQMAVAENQLQRSLGGLFAVAESYPQLKSNENFLELQRQLADTEDRIAAGRRFYNGNVRAYNTRVEAFPSSFIASRKGWTKEQYFEVDDPQVRSAVKVDFSSLSGNQAAPAPQIPQATPQPSGLPPVGQPPQQVQPPQQGYEPPRQG